MNNKILNPEQEKEVFNLLKTTTHSLKIISEKFNCSVDVIQRIKKENNLFRKNDTLKESKIKEIIELHFLVGEWAFLCKIKAKDMDDYTRIISIISKEIKPQRIEDIISPKTFKREV